MLLGQLDIHIGKEYIFAFTLHHTQNYFQTGCKSKCERLNEALGGKKDTCDIRVGKNIFKQDTTLTIQRENID